MTNEGNDLSIVRSKIMDNRSTGEGGGVAVFGDGGFTLRSSQVTQNHAGITGGGIALFNTAPSTIIGSLIAQNNAASGGGIGTAAPLEVRASKILSNSADLGGGIGATNDLTLNFCIVSGNFALSGGGIFHANGTDLDINGSKVIKNFSADGETDRGALSRFSSFGPTPGTLRQFKSKIGLMEEPMMDGGSASPAVHEEIQNAGQYSQLAGRTQTSFTRGPKLNVHA
jgi:hypothetical protein